MDGFADLESDLKHYTQESHDLKTNNPVLQRSVIEAERQAEAYWLYFLMQLDKQRKVAK